MSSQDSEGDYDADIIEDPCNYVSTTSYPASAYKNIKRIIRRKPLRLAVKDGEVYYKKKKGEVCCLRSYICYRSYRAMPGCMQTDSYVMCISSILHVGSYVPITFVL